MNINEDDVDNDVDTEMSLEEIEAAYLLALETADAAEALLPYQENVEGHSFTNSDDDLPDRALQTDRIETGSSSQTLFENTLTSEEEVEDRITPTEVVESLLFVGGGPLSAKKLIDVLGGTTSHEEIDEQIDNLNQVYRSENRPYEIRLVEGGYQMCLLTEYEPVRRRVFGQGPKDVKLNQEALEALAFVAYQQPVERKDLEETGKKNAGGLLRQLLRRQLIVLERENETGSQTYRTTKRFLELFGLTSIEDLPQTIDFNFK